MMSAPQQRATRARRACLRTGHRARGLCAIGAMRSPACVSTAAWAVALLLASSFALCGAPSGAQAQAPAGEFPSRPIRLVIPASPGGPADIVARIVAQGYGESLGQPLVADNRAGAGGVIGAEIVARSLPDGYTLMISHSGPLAIEPLRQTRPSYDTLRDFTALSLIAEQAYVLLVHPKLAASTVGELVALARARPGQLNFASGGPGTGIHMAAELFNVVAGLKVAHVPYKGAGPGMAALLGAEVDLMFNGISAALPQIKAGKLRALATAGAKRSPLLPELPTLIESGIRVDTSGWYGFVGPARLPATRVAPLHRALLKTLASAEVRERFAAQGIDSIGSTPEAFSTFLREEIAKWRKVIEVAGLKGD